MRDRMKHPAVQDAMRALQRVMKHPDFEDAVNKGFYVLRLLLASYPVRPHGRNDISVPDQKKPGQQPGPEDKEGPDMALAVLRRASAALHSPALRSLSQLIPDTPEMPDAPDGVDPYVWDLAVDMERSALTLGVIAAAFVQAQN